MDNRPRPCVSHPSIIIKSNFAHEKTTALQKHAKRWKKAYANTPVVLSAEIHPFIHTKGHKKRRPENRQCQSANGECPRSMAQSNVLLRLL